MNRDVRSPEVPEGFPPIVSFMLALFAICLVCMGGCSPNGNGQNASGTTGSSLFDESPVPFRAVVVTLAQTPYPLESLDVNGSPASEVAPLFKAAILDHEEQVAAVEMEINRVETELHEAESRLDAAKEVVASGYNERLPKVSEAPDRDDPEYLDWISEASRQKADAGQWYERQKSATIRPIEGEVASIQSNLRRLQSRLSLIREDYTNFLFSALPAEGARHWVTDTNGHAVLSVPRTEPWVIWANSSRLVPGVTTERYRWILKTPDELDSNGKLFADHRNLLDIRGLVLDRQTGMLGVNGDTFQPE